jgi:GTP-binding protein EngB required for normal cell division
MPVPYLYRNQPESSSLQHFLKILEEFYGQLNLPGKSEELQRIATTITASDFIDVAVVGQFKAGKSSFINSLLGEQVIPTGFLPVTSVITRVRYGKHLEVILKHQNGQSETLLPEMLIEYCSEQFNPGNKKKIEVIDVYHPALRDIWKIRLVDTPGLGSISEETTRVTTRWLTEASFALLIISSERPLAAADLGVVEELKKICPRISLIITKIDLVPQDEHPRLMDYIQTGISSISTDFPIQILGYSIYNHSDDYRGKILQQIIRPMQEQFDDEKAMVSVHKISSLTRDCLQYTEIVLRSQEKFRDDEKQLLGVVSEIENNREHYKTELLYTTTAFKGEVRAMLENIIIPFQEEIIRKLNSSFDKEMDLQKGMLFKVTQWFEKWIIDSIRSEVDQTYPETLPKIDLFLHGKAGFYTHFIKTFQQSYKQFIHDLYSVDIRIEPVSVTPLPIGTPDISVYRIFDSHLDLFFFFLPVRLIRPLLKRSLKKQIEYEVEKNLRRHISILTEKILKIIDEYHKFTSKTIQDEVITLQRLVQSKSGMETPYLEMQHELTNMMTILNTLNLKTKTTND